MRNIKYVKYIFNNEKTLIWVSYHVIEVTGVLGMHSLLCGSVIVVEVFKKLPACIFRVRSLFTAARLAVNTPLPRLLVDELFKLYIPQIHNFWKKDLQVFYPLNKTRKS
jgi:hypothetical protein